MRLLFGRVIFCFINLFIFMALVFISPMLGGMDILISTIERTQSSPANLTKQKSVIFTVKLSSLPDNRILEVLP